MKKKICLVRWISSAKSTKLSRLACWASAWVQPCRLLRRPCRIEYARWWSMAALDGFTGHWLPMARNAAFRDLLPGRLQAGSWQSRRGEPRDGWIRQTQYAGRYTLGLGLFYLSMRKMTATCRCKTWTGW